MEQTYSVELSAEEIAELSRLVGRDIDTARTDDEYENMRATWDHIGFALRNAQPVQPSALQRLEEWLLDTPIEAARVTIRTNGLTRHEAVLEKDGAWVYEIMTIDTTIETLMQEVATLRAEVARLQALPVWEPVEAIDTCPEWECACGEDRCKEYGRTLYMESEDIIGIWSDGGATDVTVVLPDDIRLCRLVSQEASND